MHKTVKLTLIAAIAAGTALPLTRLLAEAPGDRVAKPMFGASAPATEPVKTDPNKVVLTVGGQSLTAGDFEALLTDLGPQGQQVASMPGGKRLLADEIVKFKLAAGEAKRQKLDENPKVKHQVEMAQEQVLAGALAESVQKSIDDATVQKYYEEHKADYGQVQARHILVATARPDMPVDPAAKKQLTDEQAKAKADDLKKRLDKGDDFAKLAKAESDDPGSGANGGDLGSFGKGQMVKAFDDVAFALKDNEISPVVKTEFGYHIIQVIGHKAQAFDEVSSTIRQKLVTEKLDQVVNDLKKTNKAVLDEAYFGPAQANPHAGMPPMPQP